MKHLSLTSALLCLGASFSHTALANACKEAGVSPIEIESQNEDTVTIQWFHDGPSICRESYNVILGLVGYPTNQHVETAGRNCPTVPPSGEPQRPCRHTLSIPCCTRHRIGVQACHKRTASGARSECSPWRWVEVGSAYAVTPTQPDRAMYSLANNRDLRCYGHERRDDGTFRSASSQRIQSSMAGKLAAGT
jgi:hypothetical protein